MNKQEKQDALDLIGQYWPAPGGQTAQVVYAKKQLILLEMLRASGWKSPSEHEDAVEAAFYDGMYAERCN